MELASARVGYSPYRPGLDHPGDRRRFAFYAEHRGLALDRSPTPDRDLDLVVLSAVSDITAWRRAPGRTKLVYDLIDSYLAIPRTSPRALGRGMVKRMTGETSRLAISYRRAIENMCRRADAVVCTTDEQRAAISQLNPNVHVVLDYHGGDVTRAKSGYRAATPFRLAWEGLPHTLPTFRALGLALREPLATGSIELHLVTDLEFHQYAGRLRRRRTQALVDRLLPGAVLHEWNPSTLERVMTQADVAVIPADLSDPFSAGKPENKLLLLWRLGVPVVAAATPAYVRAMTAAGVELACRSEDEWRRTLARVMEDEALRRCAGEAGRAYVERTASAERLIAGWDHVVRTIGFEI